MTLSVEGPVSATADPGRSRWRPTPPATNRVALESWVDRVLGRA